MNNIFSSLNSFTHFLIKNVVKPGDSVVDATAGNGNDTLLLASLVGENGKVYAFDIQECALNNTYNLLAENKLLDRVTLIKTGHENMLKYIQKKVKAVMFNLGYLPKGDHKIITLPETTTISIRQALELLEAGGLITIMVYSGHQGGIKEKEAVLELVSNLDKKCWDILQWSFLNRRETAPQLIVIHRRGG
ncbi:MAG: hypothetical protein PWQ67_1522 [Clostridia bacterium]|nr:hypothetical protein [Clostridia bacterium]MDN5323068.1 hypothetical protein [Clostridia bacterium]